MKNIYTQKNFDPETVHNDWRHFSDKSTIDVTFRSKLSNFCTLGNYVTFSDPLTFPDFSEGKRRRLAIGEDLPGAADLRRKSLNFKLNYFDSTLADFAIINSPRENACTKSFRLNLLLVEGSGVPRAKYLKRVFPRRIFGGALNWNINMTFRSTTE